MMAETIGPDQAPKWADSPLPTPTYGPGGRATVVCSTAIAAPPATCVAIVLDPSTYASWNRFVPRVTVRQPSPSPSPSPSSPPASTPASLLAQLPLGEKQKEAGQLLLLLGTRFQFEVHLDPDSPRAQNTDLAVSVLEEFERGGRKGLRVSWKTEGDPWYLRAERTQEFLEQEGGEGSDYVCYETFFGPVAPMVKLFVGSALLNGFGLWMSGLKKAAEEKVKEEEEKKKTGTEEGA